MRQEQQTENPESLMDLLPFPWEKGWVRFSGESAQII